MNQSKRLLVAAVSAVLISSCSTFIDTKQVSYINQAAVQNVLTTDLEQLWSKKYNHYQPKLLSSVALAISELTSLNQLNNQSLDKLSHYLRIFSSFGPDKDWEPNTATNINSALLDLQDMDGFYQITPATARLHENYAVALYRLYFLAPLQPLLIDHIEPLTKLVNLYAASDLPADQSVDYALWEVLRAAAILPFEARRKNKPAFTNALIGDDALQQALVSFISGKNGYRNNDNWPKQHATWALSQYYNLYNKQYWAQYNDSTDEQQRLLDQDKLTIAPELAMTNLDDQVWNALSLDKTQSHQQLKTQFSVPYVVSTFRGKSECQEGSLKERCITPTIEQALPIKHICSDSLYILTQQMTPSQLAQSCDKLTRQESNFHQKLDTNNVPVANDFNQQLRVVIFKDSEQYNKYGQLVFDISTDNGGMYIEGITQDPDNIATFYSYEHFWVRPQFKVWNLNHEYVHYLDGRFIKYDTFNHFPSHLVWWSEGLAEYISKENDNPRAFKHMVEAKTSDWPTLGDVFDTTYNDGSDRVYKWSYLAVRFMAENHLEQYRQLAHFLKTDYFEGYKKLLDQLGQQHADEFVTWLTQHKDDFNAVSDDKDPTAPRQFYRYSYKNYLKPAVLTETKHHMHWQYWHENAQK